MAFRYALRELAVDLAAAPAYPFEPLHLRLARRLAEAAHDWSPEGRMMARRLERHFVKELFGALAISDDSRRATLRTLVQR